MKNPNPYFGTAGWSVPKIAADDFPKEGSHLERYSQVLNAVEINSSFYRHHEAKTYLRWGNSVPANFRFSVKLAKEITHEKKLQVKKSELKEILMPIAELKKKFAVLLVQLPKSFAFNEKHCDLFLGRLRELYDQSIAFEMRSPTWECKEVLKLFKKHRVSQVAADPVSIAPYSEELFTTGGFTYFRFHGSPVIYKSQYTPEVLAYLKGQMRASLEKGLPSWIIFDNTTFGYATQDAVRLKNLIDSA